MVDPPFPIGHLHKAEQDRIREGRFNPYEQEMLAKNEDPWAKFRGPLPPDTPSPSQGIPPSKDDTGTPEQPATPKRKGVEISKLIGSEPKENSDTPKPDLKSLESQLRGLGTSESAEEVLAKIQRQLREAFPPSKPGDALAESVKKIAEMARDGLKPPTPTNWAEFYQDPASDKTTVRRHSPTNDEEYPPDLVDYSKELRKRQASEEKARTASIEKAIDNALKKAEDRARSEEKWEGLFSRMGDPLGEEQPHEPKPLPAQHTSHSEWFWGGTAVLITILALVVWGLLFVAAWGFYFVWIYRAPWFHGSTKRSRRTFKGLIVTMIAVGLFLIWLFVPTPFTSQPAKPNDPAQVASATPTVKTLREYFAEEGGQCWRKTITRILAVEKDFVFVEAQMCMNFTNKAQHLAFYIPETDYTPEVSSRLISSYQDTIKDFVQRYQGKIEVGPIEGRKTQVKDLRFTRYIVIFHEVSIPQDRRDELESLAKQKDLLLEFHSQEYVLARIPK